MPYLIGVLLATGVLSFFWLVGFLPRQRELSGVPDGRERVCWSMLLIVVAHYYILFALMGGSPAGDSGRALISESIAASVFLIAALVGFKKSLWLVAIALAAHGVFDFFHARIIADPGVPPWWPAFCMSFDVVAGLFLALVLVRRPAHR